MISVFLLELQSGDRSDNSGGQTSTSSASTPPRWSSGGKHFLKGGEGKCPPPPQRNPGYDLQGKVEIAEWLHTEMALHNGGIYHSTTLNTHHTKCSLNIFKTITWMNNALCLGDYIVCWCTRTLRTGMRLIWWHWPSLSQASFQGTCMFCQCRLLAFPSKDSSLMFFLVILQISLLGQCHHISLMPVLRS